MSCGLVSCSSNLKVLMSSDQTTKALPYDAKVYVYGVYDTLPKKSIHIAELSGSAKSSVTTSDYSSFIEKAKEKARAVGANIIKVQKHETSNTLTGIRHSLDVNLYHNNTIGLLEEEEKQRIQNPNLINADFALLHVYRFNGLGTIISYNLKLGDSTICRVKNNFCTTIKITKKGLNNVSARTETTVELPIDVTFGKEYFLKCTMTTGLLVGRPRMEFVAPEIGRAELYTFNKYCPYHIR